VNSGIKLGFSEFKGLQYNNGHHTERAGGAFG
jgi:hypothetical protein